MTGILCFSEEKEVPRPFRLRRTSILGVSFLLAEVRWSGRRALLCRRLLRAARKMEKCGVRAFVLPQTLPFPTDGIRAVDAAPLRRAIAAPWAEAVVRETRAEGTLAVSAEVLRADVVRAVTLLSSRHRRVRLEVQGGGEELCRKLRRERGVTLLLSRVQSTDALHLAFDRTDSPCPRFLPLFGETPPLPQLTLPREAERALPTGVRREQMLAALLAADALRAEDLTLVRP